MKRHHILMIDGGDGVGKTTIARFLVDRDDAVGYAAFKAPAPDQDWEREYLWPILRPSRPWAVVMDRCFVSELVWPTVFGRPPIFGKAEAGLLLRSYAAAGARLIIPTRPPADVTASLEARGETRHQIADALADQAFFIQLALSGALDPLPWQIVPSSSLPPFNKDAGKD